MQVKFSSKKNYTRTCFRLEWSRGRSNFARYRTQDCLTVVLGPWESSCLIFSGRARLCDDFSDYPHLKPGDRVRCVNSEETVQLREEKIYEIANTGFRNLEGVLYPEISLQELRSDLFYEASRFVKEEV